MKIISRLSALFLLSIAPITALADQFQILQSSTKTPVSHAKVTVSHLNVYTDSYGRVSIDVAPGLHEMKITSKKYQDHIDVQIDNSNYMKTIYIDE